MGQLWSHRPTGCLLAFTIRPFELPDISGDLRSPRSRSAGHGDPNHQAPQTKKGSRSARPGHDPPPAESTTSEIGEVVQIVSRCVVAVGAEILARRAIDDPYLGSLLRPLYVVRMAAEFDVADGICLRARRPNLAGIANRGDVAVTILTGMGYSSICHDSLFSFELRDEAGDAWSQRRLGSMAPRRSLLVADALVLGLAAVQDPTSRGVALEPGLADLELTASLDRSDSMSAPGVLGHFQLHLWG